ncbi:ABC transporter ATP-binding protein [Alkalicoccobacillus murimartini]|uniref:Sn-glycerol 3-phosphate transport system ATP-binding protein n=1 Tax=Alkalicoccobacillus murimartini TaxID=171685 RepID=A0ABT9YJ37_9BACI|nr:ABC transporter ATP-binding protein [Alkalicoccobacillus murimartini]MDQ0207222.1 sn-glycerol 3-phosphate transport system ATP-binding protein [Alkalicoccobacillus murimartini]
MASITLKNISKQFGDDLVINDLNLHIKDGSFTVFVGPSGCGKSTTLRMIAGLEKQTKGEIWIDDKRVDQLPPGKRDIAMVFQNYALYPTMTVKGNIEFGLKNKKVPKAERERLIQEIAGIVGLTPYLSKKPQVLSGGQRQRVALARAMVKKPKVFVFDEPLSNLDAKLRGQMRTELIQLHKRLGTTFVYVTHDQTEAMSMGDEIVILNKGLIQQMDAPMNIYQQPANVFSAQFIGTPAMNVFTVDELPDSFQNVSEGITRIGFRPEHVSMSSALAISGEKAIVKAEIKTVETLGSETLYQIETSFGGMVAKSVEPPLKMGDQVYISIAKKHLHYFDRSGVAVLNTKAVHKEVGIEA